MKALKDWSIRAKVVVAFALILCCTVGLALFAVQRLAGVNEAAEHIRSNSLPGTRVLGEVAYFTTRFRAYQATYALATDPEAKASDEKFLTSNLAQAEKAFTDYGAVVTCVEIG